MNHCPPHRIEPEKGVLGSMLLSPRQAIPESIEKQWEGGYVEVLCNAYHDF
jgi:hypothetical protein